MTLFLDQCKILLQLPKYCEILIFLFTKSSIQLIFFSLNRNNKLGILFEISILYGNNVKINNSSDQIPICTQGALIKILRHKSNICQTSANFSKPTLVPGSWGSTWRHLLYPLCPQLSAQYQKSMLNCKKWPKKWVFIAFL